MLLEETLRQIRPARGKVFQNHVHLPVGGWPETTFARNATNSCVTHSGICCSRYFDRQRALSPPVPWFALASVAEETRADRSSFRVQSVDDLVPGFATLA